MLLAIAAPAALASAASIPEPRVMTWTVDGVKRQAIVYAPSKESNKTPVVLSFHGHGDTMQNFQSVGLQEAWPEAIVVYPQGLPTSRPGEPALPGWQTDKGRYGDRDLKLVDQVLASLHASYTVDDARVYATGFSNGAGFTYLLWAERPNVFAAFAPVVCALLCGVGTKADTITLSVAPTNGTGNCASFSVPTNVVAQIISAYCWSSIGAFIRIGIGSAPTPSNGQAYYAGSSSGAVAGLPVLVVGPATITLCATNSGVAQTLSFCTIQTTSSYSFTPSSSVIIPNDGGGPVTIILESSTDLINWTAANPGTYGTTSSNRFFRVRAER